MKCLIILFLKLLLLSNFAMAETVPTKSKILKQSSKCIKDMQTQVCRELVSEIEELQRISLINNLSVCVDFEYRAVPLFLQTKKLIDENIRKFPKGI